MCITNNSWAPQLYNIVLQGGGREIQYMAGLAEPREHVWQPHPRGGHHKALPEGPALLQRQEAIPCAARHSGADQQGVLSCTM